MFRRAIAAAVSLLIGAGSASAYEFWIEPGTFRCEVGQEITAAIRIGEEFRGVPQAVSPERFARFTLSTAEGELPLQDVPNGQRAVRADPVPEGLAVLVHETTPRSITWGDGERFHAFARNKGLGDLVEAGAEASGDGPVVREEHVRYAKALVAIGHGRGEDRLMGLRTEFLALANPYADDLAGAMPVQLWLDGEPRRTAQVEVFARPAAGGETTRTVYETDSNGVVILDVSPGHQYLVHSVALEPGGEAEGEPDWRTLWASLTFEVPAPQPPS